MRVRASLIAVVVGAVCLVVPAVSAARVRRLLAFERGNGAWIARPDGSHARRLGPGGYGYQAILSPDGTKVAVVRRRPTVHDFIAVYSTSGGPTRYYLTKMYGPGPIQTGIDGFSPDSRYLAVTTALTGIAVIDTVAGHVTMVPEAWYGSWAPRRPDRLVYSGLSLGSTLYVWQSKNQSDRLLARNASYPVWGPRSIAFDRNTQVWTIRPNGSGARRVTAFRPPVNKGVLAGMTPIVWSPNGRWLVAQTGGLVGVAFDVLVSLTTGKTRPLAFANDAVYPAGFTRDSARLVIGFTSPNYSPPGYAATIVTTTLWGTGVHVLLRHAWAPSWNF